MIYEPKIVFNPNNRVVEFMHDHMIYSLKPGEKKLMDGAIAYHALNQVKAGLKEYVPETDDKLVVSSTVAYERMPWGEIISLASQRGLFKLGMDKDATIKALIEADGQRT